MPASGTFDPVRVRAGSFGVVASCICCGGSTDPLPAQTSLLLDAVDAFRREHATCRLVLKGPHR
jgi:hypothetical protein